MTAVNEDLKAYIDSLKPQNVGDPEFDYGPFAKELRGLDDLEMEFFKEMLETGRQSIFFNDGGLVKRFEKAFARYAGAPAALARTNGMCALADMVSMSGAGVGDEIICDPIVHFGALATLFTNAVPRFCDIDPDTYLMDPESLRATITPLTKAVIVTHLWGLPARIDEIAAICKEHNLFLIEDCAHAVGARWKDQHVGTFGNAGMFSLQEFKQLSTGDGSLITVRDQAFADEVENIWGFSGESPLRMTLNWRMNEATAAVGLAQLLRVDGINDYYGETLKIFNEAIADCPWLENRLVPDEATQVGYWFACKWTGDQHGLDYDRFKALNDELELGLRFGFNERAPYEFEFFNKGNIYGHNCPYQCPIYRQKTQHVDRAGQCPVVEDVMPRLVTVNLIFLSLEAAKRQAEALHKAVSEIQKG